MTDIPAEAELFRSLWQNSAAPHHEAERARTIDVLLKEASAALEKGHLPHVVVTRNKNDPNDPLVWQLLIHFGLFILTADDPAAELRRFLGRTRGRRSQADRDELIVRAVQSLINKGSSPMEALRAIGAIVGRSEDAIKKIHYGKPRHENR